MKQQTAYFISCSEHYNHRFCVVDDYLRSCGYRTTYITSDFDHTTKEPFVCQVPGCVQIHVMPYRKNLSVERILSHRMFARKVYDYLNHLEKEPDVIIALLPPNFLGHYLSRYKKQHPNVKLIFDVFDLWPETFPSNKLGKLLAPFFAVWAWLRDHSLPGADWVITECDYFRQRLGLEDKKASTIYLCQDPLEEEGKPQLRNDGIDLCYLGAINNVIGIADICRLIQELTAHIPVTLHIIGTGERLQELVDLATAAGAEVVCHGAIYDQDAKREILDKCHYGLNVINVHACIGLTMKSVDYFRYGLPIISNVPSDTENMIMRYGVGIQLDSGCAEKIIRTSINENLQMRRNVCNLFADTFARPVIEQAYKDLLETIL